MDRNQINESKSFATEANLIKAITNLGFADNRFYVVRNGEGRFTAIFPASNIIDGDMAKYARHGFFTLG